MRCSLLSSLTRNKNYDNLEALLATAMKYFIDTCAINLEYVRHYLKETLFPRMSPAEKLHIPSGICEELKDGKVTDFIRENRDCIEICRIPSNADCYLPKRPSAEPCSIGDAHLIYFCQLYRSADDITVFTRDKDLSCDLLLTAGTAMANTSLVVMWCDEACIRPFPWEKLQKALKADMEAIASEYNILFDSHVLAHPALSLCMQNLDFEETLRDRGAKAYVFESALETLKRDTEPAAKTAFQLAQELAAAGILHPLPGDLPIAEADRINALLLCHAPSDKKLMLLTERGSLANYVMGAPRSIASSPGYAIGILQNRGNICLVRQPDAARPAKAAPAPELQRPMTQQEQQPTPLPAASLSRPAQEPDKGLSNRIAQAVRQKDKSALEAIFPTARPCDWTLALRNFILRKEFVPFNDLAGKLKAKKLRIDAAGFCAIVEDLSKAENHFNAACSKAQSLVPLLASRENTSRATKTIKALHAAKTAPGNREKLQGILSALEKLPQHG